MKMKDVLERLEKTCLEREVKLVYDDLQSEGGLCRMRDKYYIIVNRKASTETRVRILQSALARLPSRTRQPEQAPAGPWPPASEPAQPEMAVVRAAGAESSDN